MPNTKAVGARETRSLNFLEPTNRLEFERFFVWLRFGFLVTPVLLVLAYGYPALYAAAKVDALVLVDCLFTWLLLRFAPWRAIRWQLGLRVFDMVITYWSLQVVHSFVGNAYYDATYLFLVVAATATHGRRGAYWIAATAALAVLLGRLQLIANGVVPFHPRHISDSIFFGLLFFATSAVTNFLMRATAQVVELRDARARRAMEESELRYRSLFDNASDIMYTHDLQGNFLSFNCAAEKLLGYTRQELPLLSVADITAPEHTQLIRWMIERKVREGGSTTYEVPIRSKDGRWLTVEVSSHLILQNGEPIAVQGIARDVTDRRAQTAELEHQALHDSLTDLPNRVLLNDRLEQGIAAAHREGSSLGLLLIDLDRFKEVNDTFGHHQGDLLLREVGRRLCNVLRDSDTIARLGGDEFALLLERSDESAARHVASKILSALERPFVVDGKSLDIGASAGIALFPEHGEDAVVLVQHADVAMYEAKRGGGGWAVYAAENDEYTPSRLAMISDLRAAIQREELEILFQPKAHLDQSRVQSVEALLRWTRPHFGTVPPDEFIPLAEHTGLIRPLNLWVLEAALRQCVLWHRAQIELSVAVNLSTRNLLDTQLPATLQDLMGRYGAEPSWLDLEITESAIMTDPHRALQVLEQLKGMGFRISMDDFGTGYSSLGSLTRLPIDEIKIDKSFVSRMANDGNDAVIVHSLIDLGHHLGLEIVAEGVEDARVLHQLAELGCDIVQGYFLSAPLPSCDLIPWLHEFSRTNSWPESSTSILVPSAPRYASQ